MDVMNMASRRRNPILADIFSCLKYMERRGSGFKKIVSAYKSHDGYTEGMDPTFSTPWDSFVLTLPKFKVVGIEGVYVSNGDEDNSVEPGGQTSGQATVDEELRLIKENPKITRNALSKTLCIATSAVQKHINRLKSDGVIRRIGGDYGGHWEIIK